MRPALALALLLAASCGLAERPDEAPPADNDELRAMYRADQADRRAGRDIDWAEVGPRDEARRERAGEMLDLGLATTARDYYHAAMIFQHGTFGDTASAKRAFDLMETALALDSAVENGRWLRAAAWDRYLMYKDEPQWYGTQYRKLTPDSPWILWDVDTTKVNDAERAANDVPPLAAARARAEEMNRDPEP